MAAKRAEQIAAHLNYPKGMLAGQVAIVTGAGQGIGAEVARLFANEGARVVVADIDESTSFLTRLCWKNAHTRQRSQAMSPTTSTSLEARLSL